MRDSYVDDKVRAALIEGRGSRARAQRLLIEWAAKDARLLLGLARPFMKAITLAAIEGAGRRGLAVPAAKPAAPPPPQLSDDALDAVLRQMGRALGPSPAADQADDAMPSPPPGAPGAPAAGGLTAADLFGARAAPRSGAGTGAGHADAIKTIAAAFKKPPRT